MRTNEQFKELVYRKADARKAQIKRQRAAIGRGIAAFSILAVVGGVFVYSNINSMHDSAESVTEDGMLYNLVSDRGDNKGLKYYFSFSDDSSALSPRVAADMCDAQECEVYEEPDLENQIEVLPFSVEKDAETVITKLDGIQYGCGEAEISVEEAIEIAKNKCTVEYDVVKVYFDSKATVWKIAFLKNAVVGGDQSVYLNGSGEILKILYGE